MRIHNCHMHIFTIQAVPTGFLPLWLTRLGQTSGGNWALSKLLKVVIPFSSSDRLHRFAQFIESGGAKTQEDLFQDVRRFYPADSVFVALSMDMTFMGAGHPPQNFESQLEELAGLKKKYKERILPFICVDPRRSNILDLVKRSVESRGFAGIKIYPPLGYFPYDVRLSPVWDYAERNNIPVVTHASRGGVRYKGSLDQFSFRQCQLGQELKAAYRDHPWQLFAHPTNYEVLAEQYPRLRISFGHFGGDEDWRKFLLDPPLRPLRGGPKKENWFVLIMDLIAKYKGLYADISYTLNDSRLYSTLKVVLQDKSIRSKILFGSDFYMVKMDASEKSFSIDLRAFLDEADFQQIADKNARRFLFGNAGTLPRGRSR